MGRSLCCMGVSDPHAAEAFCLCSMGLGLMEETLVCLVILCSQPLTLTSACGHRMNLWLPHSGARLGGMHSAEMCTFALHVEVHV